MRVPRTRSILGTATAAGLLAIAAAASSGTPAYAATTDRLQTVTGRHASAVQPGGQVSPDLGFPWWYVNTYATLSACAFAGTLGPGFYLFWACEPVTINGKTEWELWVTDI